MELDPQKQDVSIQTVYKVIYFLFLKKKLSYFALALVIFNYYFNIHVQYAAFYVILFHLFFKSKNF